MADNVTLNPGTGGAVVATDEVGGAHYQVIKVAVGADGTAVLVSDAAPLPARAPTATICTEYSIASATGSVQLLAANTSRKGVKMRNDSTVNMHLSFSASATLTAPMLLTPQAIYETYPGVLYTGALSAVWDVATGFCRIGEFE